MTKPWSDMLALARSRYLVALLAGLTLAAAFPKLSLAGLGWIAPGLMLAAALGQSGGERFRLGYLAGLTHYLVSLYWLLLIPYRWHGIPLGPATGWLALCGVLALFPAVWVWGATEAARNKLPSTWAGRTVWALWGAALWVALEMLRARVLGGFPWDLLGASQCRMVPLIQMASITGVYGLSFLMVWFSLGLVSAGLAVVRRPGVSSSWLAETFLPLLAVALAFNFGVRRLGHTQAPARTLKVTVVQPSIPQTFIWDPNKSAERFRDLLSLCERALSNRTDLLVWPESAIPELLRYDKETAVAVSEMARRHQVWMIVGADDFEPRPNAARPEDGDFFNASFLINPEGKLVAPWYRKRSLVIFGEYVPCSRWLPFLKWFTPTQGGFTPGDQPVQFPMDGLSATASVLICFEDVFPQLARASVEPATDFLVNLTNDGWFGEGAEQWQHATSALFRAVENGRPLVRCANNGLTCWIDGQGRLGDVFHDPARSVYGQGFATFALPLPDPAHRPPPTFYNRHGDWFGWSCVAIAAPLLAWSALAARTRARAAR